MNKKVIENYFPVILFVMSFALYSWVFLTDCLIGRDEGQFLYIGKQVANGKILYADIPTARSPIPLYVFALFTWFFNDNIWLIRLLVPFLNFVISYFIFLIGKKHWNLFVGQLSSSMYIVSYSMPLFEEMYLMTDSFQILFGIISMFFYLEYKLQRDKTMLIVSGLFIGLSFLSKQYGILFFAVIIVYEFSEKHLHSQQNSNLIQNITLILSGFLFPIIIFFTYFWYKGNFDSLVDSYLIGTSSYASFIFRIPNLVSFVSIVVSFSLVYVFALYYSLTTVLSLYRDSHIMKDHFLVLWAFTFSLLMSISTSGPYMFQTLVPSSLLSAIFINKVYSKEIIFLERPSFNHLLSVMTLFLLFSNFYVIHPLEDNMNFDHQKEISNFIKENTNENETMLVYHYSPVFYYLSEVNPPQVNFSILNIGPQFLTEEKYQELVKSIEDDNVRYLVTFKGILDEDNYLDAKYPITYDFKKFLLENFVMIKTEYKSYDIYEVIKN